MTPEITSFNKKNLRLHNVDILEKFLKDQMLNKSVKIGLNKYIKVRHNEICKGLLI